MATILTTAEAQDQFSELINQVVHNKEHVILTRRGKEIAAIIPLEDLALLQDLQNKHDLLQALDALKEAREKGGIPLEQVKEEIGA
ncbi:MAG TPA: type II toxin-antitoxin system Phd/YefM family antitoxin [Gammaproteobacteria bacterium]|nr:type II toxin-antitoxin system Phd/YefM family antitoxin [Gammaproteobacteria bacterium]